ncbi:hypothetical protein EDD15DRAFT_179077 [Pisolithus albus]|nr:hypothetical protein EDD15DRAFT_179077 [Pisolithus albus]
MVPNPQLCCMFSVSLCERYSSFMASLYPGIMGSTGSGRGNLIDKLAELEGAKAPHGIGSNTQDIRECEDSVRHSEAKNHKADPFMLEEAHKVTGVLVWHLKYVCPGSVGLERTNDINLTRELHKVQAYLLYCQQLLQDFYKSVDFVKNTPNPAMQGDEDELNSAELLAREVDNLLSEMGRLEGQRTMQSDRLKNVMQLAFATVNTEDSRAMKRLTEGSMRGSAAMKQISYLTMVFLPTSLIACLRNERCGNQSRHLRNLSKQIL